MHALLRTRRLARVISVCSSPTYNTGVSARGIACIHFPVAASRKSCAILGTQAGRALQARWGSTEASPRSSTWLWERANEWAATEAITQRDGSGVSYSDLVRRSETLARHLLASQQQSVPDPESDSGKRGKKARKGSVRGRRAAHEAEAPRGAPHVHSLEGAAVAFLCEPGADYVVAQWAIWRAGGTAVPLCTSHPLAELEYVVTHSSAVAVVTDAEHIIKVFDLVKELIDPISMLTVMHDDGSLPEEEHGRDLPALPDICPDSRAMIMYTSGTTGRPKGVVTSHRALQAQITDLVTAWKWSCDDSILHFLPLHHVHGVVNKLACALWVGARVQFVKWEAAAVWDRLRQGGVSLFMAVPTVYVQMIEHFDSCDEETQRALASSAAACRLMVSGSAPLPVAVLRRWQAITGHMLLERYGMTEFGMALSNSLDPELRRAGCVGLPLPSVTVKIVAGAEEGEGEGAGAAEEVVQPPDERAGELRVKGANVFSEYLANPESTAEAFDEQGYFKTGDVAKWSEADGCYAILGRASVDIIKTGGHKVSALEVERALLEHSQVAEAAVLGVEDEVWGQTVAAVVRPVGAASGAAAEEVRGMLREHVAQALGPEKRPRRLVLVDEIPKNAMGKVNKKQLAKDVPQLMEAGSEL